MKWPLRLAVAMLLIGVVAAGAIAWSPAHTKSGVTCGGALKVVLKSRRRLDSLPPAPPTARSSASGTECEAAAELQLAGAAGLGGVFVMTAIALAFIDQYQLRSRRQNSGVSASTLSANVMERVATSSRSVPPLR